MLNKVVFKRLQFRILSKVSKQGFWADGDLGVDQVTAYLVLQSLLFETDVFFVDTVWVRITLLLLIIKDLARLCIKSQN